MMLFLLHSRRWHEEEVTNYNKLETNNNGELKLDYILVNNGTMTNVIPVSDKNNITKYIIQKIS